MPNPFTSGESKDSSPPLRILHLEDNADDAALIAWTLRTAEIQCRIVRVEDKDDYLTALRQRDIDLILSDCSVGGFSGLTALEMAHTEKNNVPFVFVTGSAPLIRTQALDQGAADCLSKDHRIQLVFLAQRIWQTKLES